MIEWKQTGGTDNRYALNIPDTRLVNHTEPEGEVMKHAPILSKIALHKIAKRYLATKQLAV